MAVLPLVLNILLTPTVVMYAATMEEFMKHPFYYTYVYGPVLWSVYHVLLAFLASRFLRSEGWSLRRIMGSFGGWSSLATVLGLIALSVLMFQGVEPVVTNAIYGSETAKQMVSEYRMVPLTLVLYTILVTSLTAGICEEIVWRGYLQTRLELRLGGRALPAIIVQAVLFGLWHFVSVHTIFTAIFGLISGFVYARTRRLLPVMVSHWLGDVIGFSAMYFM